MNQKLRAIIVIVVVFFTLTLACVHEIVDDECAPFQFDVSFNKPSFSHISAFFFNLCNIHLVYEGIRLLLSVSLFIARQKSYKIL